MRNRLTLIYDWQDIEDLILADAAKQGKATKDTIVEVYVVNPTTKDIMEVNEKRVSIRVTDLDPDSS